MGVVGVGEATSLVKHCPLRESHGASGYAVIYR